LKKIGRSRFANTAKKTGTAGRHKQANSGLTINREDYFERWQT
jgi:hypothetical protein